MPFKEYDMMCPKCGSNQIQGSGAREEPYLYVCMVCGYGGTPNKSTFKKERVMNLKRWKNRKHPYPCENPEELKQLRTKNGVPYYKLNFRYVAG